jgi:hypothetical protein
MRLPVPPIGDCLNGDRCPRGARVTLFELVDGGGLRDVGAYCLEHFHRERERRELAGQRTHLAILLELGPACAEAAAD